MKWKVGDTTITKLEEIVYPEFPDVIPAATPDVVKKVKWLFPHFATDEGMLSLSIHSLIVDTPGATLIIDTCIGNDRDRNPFEVMHMLSTSYLEDMKAAGYQPDGVDYVLCTHLHLDHVGWNTMLVEGRWVPTFPRARYLFSEIEWEDIQKPTYPEDEAIVRDCVRPVLDAGLVDLVNTDHRVTDEVWLEPTPGHTPGHVSVRIASRGEEAVITGDIVHHPIQLGEPTWYGAYDADVEQAIATRRSFCERYADRPVLVLGTHFRTPAAGHLVGGGANWRLEIP